MLQVKAPELRQRRVFGDFIVKFEHSRHKMLHIHLVFLLHKKYHHILRYHK